MTVDTVESGPIPQDVALAYQGLRKALLGFLRLKVSDNTIAEDLLHEVFLKALNAIERGDSPSNLTGWLYTIAKNSVIDHYRKMRPTDVLPDELASQHSDDNLVEQDLALCLKPLTEALPSIYRSTLLATEFEGQPLQVIADRERVSLSAIKSRASRGRQMLKQSLLLCCKVDVSETGKILDFSSHAKSSSISGSNCCGH